MIEFSKMHGLGNDFMIINAIDQEVSLSPEMIQQFADRHTGVGFDQLLLIRAASRAEQDFDYQIYNADGGEVEQCGNGARCIAEFISKKLLCDKTELVLATRHERIRTKRLRPGHIAVEFAPPKAISLHQALWVEEHEVRFTSVELANPHAVIEVDDIKTAPVNTLGDVMSTHAYFPEGANIEFVQWLSPSHVKLRVRERGVGETKACGTGAMAAMVAYFAQGECESEVIVSLPGGDLLIAWQGGNSPITMTGPAILVYDGRITLAE